MIGSKAFSRKFRSALIEYHKCAFRLAWLRLDSHCASMPCGKAMAVALPTGAELHCKARHHYMVLRKIDPACPKSEFMEDGR